MVTLSTKRFKGHNVIQYFMNEDELLGCSGKEGLQMRVLQKSFLQKLLLSANGLSLPLGALNSVCFAPNVVSKRIIHPGRHAGKDLESRQI